MEDDHRAVLLECYSDGSFTQSVQISQNCLDCMTQFRKIVKMNLLAGVLTIIVGPCQCALYFLNLQHLFSYHVIISGEEMDFGDEFVRLSVIILGLMQYVCMMVTESHSQ